MTAGKTITLTIWTFVGKVMCLLSNTPSKFVMAFLPRSKELLILWLQSQGIYLHVFTSLLISMPHLVLPFSNVYRVTHDNVTYFISVYLFNVGASNTKQRPMLCPSCP